MNVYRTEDQFWADVRFSTPYGKYHTAHITSRGVDYYEESTLNEGRMISAERLLKMLKELGHITPSEEQIDEMLTLTGPISNGLAMGEHPGLTESK